MKRRDKRRKRKKKQQETFEKDAIGRILYAAFTGQQLTINSSVMMYSDDYKRWSVDLRGGGRRIIQFKVPVSNLSRALSYNAEPITAREALEFFNQNKAYVIYPSFS
jgi:hypothetical protein